MNAKTAMVAQQDQLPGVPEPASMLEMVMRAASNPDVDAAKMEKLLDMALRLEERQAKAAYIQALKDMKPKLPVIDRKGRIVIHEKGREKTPENIQQSTPYARWEDIDEAITPILSEHGFVLTFRTGSAPDGKITVTGVLMHEKGHSEEATMPLPLDTSGSKNNVQAAGSSTSYGKRYTAMALLNIRTKGEDDDGKAAGDPPTISAADLKTLEELIKAYEEHGAQVAGILQYFKVGELAELTPAQYRKAVEMLNTKYAGKKKATK